MEITANYVQGLVKLSSGCACNSLNLLYVFHRTIGETASDFFRVGRYTKQISRMRL